MHKHGCVTRGGLCAQVRALDARASKADQARGALLAEATAARRAAAKAAAADQAKLLGALKRVDFLARPPATCPLNAAFVTFIFPSLVNGQQA